MKESAVWGWIENKRPAWLAIERIEVLFPPGLSDCFWTDKRTSVSGFLELKYCDKSNREYHAGRIPKLRPDQPLFISRQARNTVPAGIILRVGLSDAWHVWRAPGNPEWNVMIKSTEAIRNANLTFTNCFPDLEDIMRLFTTPL